MKTIDEMSIEELEQEASEIEDALDLVERKYIKDEVLARYELLRSKLREV